MKKLLSILGATGLVVSTSAVLVSCGGDKGTVEKETTVEQQITKLFTNKINTATLAHRAGYLEQNIVREDIVDITHNDKTTIMIYTTKEETMKLMNDNELEVTDTNYDAQLEKFINENINDFGATVRGKFLASLSSDAQDEYAAIEKDGSTDGKSVLSIGAWKVAGSEDETEVLAFRLGTLHSMIGNDAPKGDKFVTEWNKEKSSLKIIKDQFINAFNL